MLEFGAFSRRRFEIAHWVLSVERWTFSALVSRSRRKACGATAG
jgi:hypothetical protein